MQGTSTLQDFDKSESQFMAGIEPLLPMAYRLAYGMLRRPEEAEDAVQDAHRRRRGRHGRLEARPVSSPRRATSAFPERPPAPRVARFGRARRSTAGAG